MNRLTIVLPVAASALLLACSATQPNMATSDVAAPVVAAPAPDGLAGLERACLENPLDADAWHRLAAALTRNGQHERADQAARQARMLEEHDLRADLALVRAAPVATRLFVRADGLLELRRTEQPDDAAVLLEIRNGNGIRGMARSLARRLDESRLKVVRLSNQPGFAVGTTVVEFRGDVEDAARELAQRVGARHVIPTTTALGAANMRLLLGHDQKKKKPPRRAAMEESLREKSISAS
jgi:hypothetical protein